MIPCTTIALWEFLLLCLVGAIIWLKAFWNEQAEQERKENGN